MSGEEFRSYSRDEFLDEFFPGTEDRAAIAAGMERLRAEQRACLEVDAVRWAHTYELARFSHRHDGAVGIS